MRTRSISWSRSRDVDAHGTVVVDDVLAAVDGDGNVIATDETIRVVKPEGDVVGDATRPVLCDDGELRAFEKDVTVLVTDDKD